MKKEFRTTQLIACLLLSIVSLPIFGQEKDKDRVKLEHGQIGNVADKNATYTHTSSPDAQWYPDAGLGLFVHWGLSSVKNIDASWPMVIGWELRSKKMDTLEIKRVIKERDYKAINGKRTIITPNEYWAMAKDLDAKNYDPDKWIKAAKEAGFTYAVITTKHHEGFALWPSAYGDFSTKNFIGGKDLVRPFVNACRKYGLKVGLYFSPPDWYFNKDYENFFFQESRVLNPTFPELDANLNPRTSKPTAEETAKHRAAYAAMVRGQLTELLTNYGKIDLLWFDGRPAVDNPTKVLTQEEIRRLQPGIVMNPRMHGTGDFITFERTPPAKDPGDIWAEFCNTWTDSWSNSNTLPFRSNAFILGQYVAMRAWGVNYLPSIGPKADGSMSEAVYQNMKVIADWTKMNGKSVKNIKQMPADETASVPATSNNNFRYLFAIPEFKDKGMYEKDRLPAKDILLTLKTVSKPKKVKLLGSGKSLNFSYVDQQLQVKLPASMRTNLVDVVQIEL